MNKNPLVTVLITAYNSRDYLNLAVESVLNQEYDNLEILIVDDGSSPKLESGISRLSDSRVNYHYMRHRGLPFGLIRGMEMARGEFVAILDHDDMLTCNSILRRVDVLKKDRNLAFVYGDINYMDSENRIYSGQNFRSYNGYAEFRHAILSSLVGPVKHSGVMFRRKHVLAAGNYDATYSALYDNELLIRLAKNYGFEHLPEPVLNYRTHKNNATTVCGMRLAGIRSDFRIINAHVENPFSRMTCRIRSVCINLAKAFFEGFSFKKPSWLFQLLGPTAKQHRPLE